MKRGDFYRLLDRRRLLDLLDGAASPCYLFFLPIIARRVAELSRVLDGLFSIHYAVKANPHPTILRTIAGLGLGADVASLGELMAAIEAGVAPGDIEFSGPGKSRGELVAAVERGIGSINVESLEEISTLIRIAEAHGRLANVGVRVNPSAKGVKAGMRMAGETQFGIPEEQAMAAFKLIAAHPESVRLTGIHVHVGSQVLDPASIVASVQRALDLGLEIERAALGTMRKINVGGGWGIDYFAHQRALDLQQLGGALADLLRAPPYRGLRERTELIIEPGRLLVGEAGVYATRVLYRKRNGDREYAIVDGGMHHNYLLAGGMGQTIRRNFELDILPAACAPRARAEGLSLDVAGRLCTPQDILATSVPAAEEVLPGDHIVFFNCGAYGFSASPAAFLSHPAPSFCFIEEMP